MTGAMDAAASGAAAAGTVAAAAVLVAGGAAALLSLRARRWADAVLELAAAASLALLLAGITLRAEGGRVVPIIDQQVPADAAQAMGFRLVGDGLGAAAWHDLPARPLQWQMPADDAITLAFPRTLALGRSFALSLRRSQPGGAWQLQLLDENSRLLAQAAAVGNEATVHWLPPVAEAMVLQARVLDGAGAVVHHGPVPLQVQDAPPLLVQGRFSTASFDTQALNALLVAGNAVVDWQVTLGKALTRSETARAPAAAPDVVIIDAGHYEQAAPAARAALLAQAGSGAVLLILAGNASDRALWARDMQLPLRAPAPVAAAAGVASAATAAPPAAATAAPQSANPARQWQVAPGLQLDGAALAPDPRPHGAWAAADKATPWLWRRAWQRGHIAWLDASGWHRHAITAPQALAAWLQAVLDGAGVRQVAGRVWEFPDPMPVVGQRTVVCARGVDAQMALQVVEPAPPEPGIDAAAPAASLPARAAVTTALPQAQRIQLLARADNADAACAALWPRHAGWLDLQAGGAPAAPGRLYIHARDDWPAWQRALRRDATQRQAARALTAPEPRRVPLPAWPPALGVALALLALWWRERRAPPAAAPAG